MSTRPQTRRSYLQAEEQAIAAAKAAYVEALEALQAACEHRVVLHHTSSSYTEFWVCEDCGITCVAEWGSPMRARGERDLMSRRSYEVSWSEFARTTAAETRSGDRW